MASVGMYPAAALIAGAAAGILVDASLTFLRWPMTLSAVVAIAMWRSHRFTGSMVALLVGFVCAGGVLAGRAREAALDRPLRGSLDRAFEGFALEDIGPEGDHDPLPARATLLEDAAVRDGFVSLRVRVTALSIAGRWTHTEGGASISVSGEVAPAQAGQWTAGRLVEAPMTFRRPARYFDDGVPDFERDLALDGTTLFGSVKSGLLVEVVAGGTPVEEYAARVRARVRRAVERWISGHDAVAGAIITAVLIGDRTGLPDGIRDRLQAAGTYHVIAISGGNIAILAGLVLVVLAGCGVRGRTAAIAAIVVLMVYTQVAVAGPSVWRATLMAVIYLVARALDHRTNAWQATAAAAGVMVVAYPLQLRDPGFLLTFGATVVLIEAARRAGGLLPQARFLGWIAASIVASVAIEVVLLPVSAQAFARVTCAGLLLNLVAVPAMAVAQVGGLVVVAADAVPAIAAPAGWIAGAAATMLVDSARLVDAAPWLASRVPPPGLAVLVAYYVSLLVVMHSGTPPRFRRVAAPVLAALLIFIIVGGRGVLARTTPLKDVRLTMFDVGQGEALLLESPAGAIQIDAGGAPFGNSSFDLGARVLVPALWARGVRALDTLLVTHGDPDHIGGAPILLEEFRPTRLWEGVDVPRHVPSRELRASAAAAGARLEFRRAGDVVPWGGATIRVLHPPEPDWERPRVRNDDSVVLEVRYGDVAMLFTGDIGAEVERALVPRLSPARIRILKVGHHGSRTSTSAALLAAWRPQFALISAGRGNSFGHPTPEVLRRLEKAGAQIFRTDRDGQITLETDGSQVNVRTYVGG